MSLIVEQGIMRNILTFVFAAPKMGKKGDKLVYAQNI